MSEGFQNGSVDTDVQFFELARLSPYGALPLSHSHVLRAFHVQLAFPQEVWSPVDGG